MKNISVPKKISIVLAGLAAILLAVYSAPRTVGAMARITPVAQDPAPNDDPNPGSGIPYSGRGFQGGWGMHGAWGMPRGGHGMHGGDWGIGHYRGGMMGINQGYCYGASGSGGSFVPGAGAFFLTTPEDVEDVSFTTNIQPLFNERCVACHGSAGGLSLGSYDEVMIGGNNGPVIIPGNPASSRLVQYVGSGYMPYGGPPLIHSQVQTIVNWVAADAPNN